jgi:outer membrane protein assembly factor BamB
MKRRGSTLRRRSDAAVRGEGCGLSEIVLIDLGEVREAPVVTRRPPSPRRRRAIGAVAVLAGVLAVAAPAPSAAALVERRVPAAIGDVLAVAGDRMYVIDKATGQSTITTRTVTAYTVPEGERIWQANVPPTVEAPWPTRIDDTLLFQTYDVDGSSEVLVLDEASGAVLWRRRADVMGLAPGHDGSSRSRLLLSVRPAAGTGFKPELISAVDLRTGASTWSYKPPRDASAIPVWRRGWPETSYLVTAMRSGWVEVRHLATGRLTAQAQLRPPMAPAPADEEMPPWLTTDEDLLLVSKSPTDGEVTAYGVERLDRRWTARVETGGGEWYTGWDCGDLMCFSVGETGMSALDRATGRLRWRTDWHWAERSGDLLIVGTHGSPYSARPLVLLDPATGQVRHLLGRWELVGRPAESGSWLVMRHDLTTNRARFGVLEPGIPDVQFLGSVTGVTPDCHAAPNALICRRLDGSIGIWRYR